MLSVVTESKTDLATSKLIEELGAIVQTKPSELYEASFDGLKVQGETGACILAKEDEHVGKVLRIANEYGIPITTKGAGSSLTGGATQSVEVGFLICLIWMTFFWMKRIDWSAVDPESWSLLYKQKPRN